MPEPSTELVPVETTAVQLGVVSANGPKELVARATEAADALAAVIEAKKLYSNISGKRYVRCEGWTTLAAMMGVLPREVSAVKREDGSYEATVELVRMGDQAVLTRASAECGTDEPTWNSRPAYARRSMAVTRATSKACRIAFSWVMVLAGYEVTPAEEIPHDDTPVQRHAPRPAHVDRDGVVKPTLPFGKSKGTLLESMKDADLQAALDWAIKTKPGHYAQFETDAAAELASRKARSERIKTQPFDEKPIALGDE